jgi:hypothetical protein
MQDGDIHVTVAYSKEPLLWPEPAEDSVTVRARHGRSVEALGDKGAVVLRFPSPTLEARWQDILDRGGVSDFDSFKPHVTLTWEAPAGLDLDSIKPYTGPLVFGAEVMKPIDPDWSPTKVMEKSALPAGNIDGELHRDERLSGRRRKRKPLEAEKAFSLNQPRDKDGKWSETGAGEGKESKHATMPLPDKASDGRAMYDIPDEDKGGMLTSVVRKPDGSYYGDTGEFDFSAPNATELRAKLTRWRAKYVGWEGMQKAGARHSRADLEMLQTVHDNAVALGATCSGHVDEDEVGKGADFEKKEVAGAVDEQVKVLKVDPELGLVFGWAIVSKIDGEDYYDTQGDNIPEGSMLKAATEFMVSRRVAKEMHVGDGKGLIVFAWPMTAEIAKAMGVQSKYHGLMIAMKPDSPELLGKFQSGEYTGFSIGGKRVRDKEVA